MAKYVLKKQVPILDEHELVKGNKVIEKLDYAKLSEIAQLANKRVEETGDLVPLVIGHTEDDKPETDQPPLVGYAKNFKVSKLKKSERTAIHADFYFMKDKVELAKNFPRRSVELWLDDWKIDPISLLGPTTPARDLGVLKMGRGKNGKEVLRYSKVAGSSRVKYMLEDGTNDHEYKGSDMDTDRIVDEVLRKLMETAPMKKLMEQADMGEGPDPFEDDLPLDPMLESDPMLDDEYVDEDEIKGKEPVGFKKSEDSDKTHDYNKGGAYPSGSNTSTKMSKQEKAKVQQSSDRVKLSRLSLQNKALTEQVKELRLKFAKAERTSDLTQLEAEGYVFDKADELEAGLSMSNEQWKGHTERIRKNYQKAPIGFTDGRVAIDDSVSRANPSLRDTVGYDQMEEVVKYALANDLDYEEAKLQFSKKDKTA